MYNYGTLTKGSYFGDISIALDEPSEFSFLYDPNYGDAKPLSLFKVDCDTFREILDKFPLEKENWMTRARQRKGYFQSYKSITLLKMMKTIVKDTTIVRHNMK